MQPSRLLVAALVAPLLLAAPPALARDQIRIVGSSTVFPSPPPSPSGSAASRGTRRR